MGAAANTGIAIFAVFGVLPFLAAIFFGERLGRSAATNRSVILPAACLVLVLTISFYNVLHFSNGLLYALLGSGSDMSEYSPDRVRVSMLLLRGFLIAVAVVSVWVGYRRARRVV